MKQKRNKTSQKEGFEVAKRNLRSPQDVIRMAKEAGVQIVDLRFTDLPGTWQHFSIPVRDLTEELFEEGIGF
jgi:Glutamine synthetase